MSVTAHPLRAALEAVVRAVPERALAEATAELSARYRSVEPAGSAILSTPARVAAYAAYRMPATTAVVERVLTDLTMAGQPAGWSPRSQLDIGAGTGAAAFAARAVLGVGAVLLVDRVPAALAVARQLLDAAEPGAAATVRTRVGRVEDMAGLVGKDRFDLVTLAHVLSELSPDEQGAAVATAMGSAEPGGVVVVTEPGTPDGYERILAVRGRLLQEGWMLLGPCPHAASCPLAAGDWCHFAVRVERSALHRRIKGGELSYEDEKYAWVAATRPSPAASSAVEPEQDWARVLRRPLIRKGFVELSLCRPDGGAGRAVVTRSRREAYRRARDLQWGDRLEPGQTTP